MIDPKQIRKDLLAQRNTLSPDELKEKSALITKTLLELESIKNSKTIFVYVSFRSEVNTEELIDTLIRMGKNVTVPITRVKEKRLDAISIQSRSEDLVPGYCDIPEPKAELYPEQSVSPEQIDVILLPGSVFDERGGRFGYGGGYYDRFVSSVPDAVRIGLAFDLQIIEKAPLAPHDEILDLVVTESRIIRGKR